jgi:diadenylate cyclase
MRILHAIQGVNLLEVLDILLMAILIYAVLIWFKQKRAFFILTGILICGLIYLIAYQLNLFLITYMLRAFFAVILIALIVIFREELRDLFEQIALWSINRGKKFKMLPEGANYRGLGADLK